MRSFNSALACSLVALGGLGHLPGAAGQACPSLDDKLTADDGTNTAAFGVAVAHDGSTRVVGAPGQSGLAPSSGAAYLFDASTGQQTVKLVAADGGPGDGFGGSVSIAAGRVLVGAPFDTHAAPAIGSAYVFDAATGAELMKLVPSDGQANDLFGTSVALSGTRAIVGAPKASGVAANTGAVYVFDLITGLETGKLFAADGAGSDAFGEAVALDGTTALVGAWGDDDNGSVSGSAYLFDVGAARQIAKLLPGDGAALDSFGRAVALRLPRAVVGAPGSDAGAPDGGAAYVFDVPAGTERARLLPAGLAAQYLFGTAVAVDGSCVLVGATGDDLLGSSAGAAWFFDADTGDEVASVRPADGVAFGWFGSAVAVLGTAALVGASGDDDDGPQSGSAYVVGVPAAPVAYCTAKPNALGCPTGIGWSGAPGLSEPGPFDVAADDVANGRNGLLFYGLSGRAALPFLGGTLCAAPPLRRTPVQSSGGSSPPAADCSGAFSFDFNAWAQSGADALLAAGREVNAQYWWRDPANPDGTGVALTDAVEFALCP